MGCIIWDIPDCEYFLEGRLLAHCHEWFGNLRKKCDSLQVAFVLLEKSVPDIFVARSQLHVEGKPTCPYPLDAIFKGQEILWSRWGVYLPGINGMPYRIAYCLEQELLDMNNHAKLVDLVEGLCRF